MWKINHLLCSEAPGDEGGGGGDQPAGNEGNTLLDTGAGDWLPEKFRVKDEAGALNIEQSARKMADSYSHLAKRMGSGDAPPKTAEEYAPEVETEGFNWDDFKSDPRAQSFMKAAHAKGITNDQMSFILGEYTREAGGLVNGAAALDADAARAELQQTWKTDAEFNQNVGLAYRAFNALADDADKGRINEIGNNPIVLRLLAKMGAEMREDAAPAGEVSGEDLQGVRDLMKSEAYTNDKHPDHEKVSAQVSAFYRRHYGDNPVG
ncbi:hypothetical protein [Pantoea sp. BAV 3049]|uniref:hypothetical protein n=1 Tax=Pantoea sp. BAV 3049 TaxID=2654188 RepID=UPI00131DCBF0|nr:hypothetical protein [Pantoea sp. BAV 3049]